MTTTPRFALGRCVATPAALRLLADHNASPIDFLVRHQHLDPGCLDAVDAATNRRALENGARIFSAYLVGDDGEKVWVITEAVNDEGHRHSTCVMTPKDY